MPQGLTEPLDLWPKIEEQYEEALVACIKTLMKREKMLPLMRERYIEGCKEHKGDWMTRPLDWFGPEACEEGADMLTYYSMRIIARDLFL